MKQSRRVGICTSESTFFMSEEDGRCQILGDGGTVHLNEWLVPSGTFIMQDMGNMFLSGTAFTAYHYGKVVICNTLRLFYKFLISSADTSDDFRVVSIPASAIQRLVNRFYKWNVMDRLLDKLYSPFLHGIYGSWHIAVLGHDDKGNLLPVLVNPVEYLDAASIRKTEVTQNKVVVRFLQTGQTFSDGCNAFRCHSSIFQPVHDETTQDGVVFNYQNPYHASPPSIISFA